MAASLDKLGALVRARTQGPNPFVLHPEMVMELMDRLGHIAAVALRFRSVQPAYIPTKLRQLAEAAERWADELEASR